MVMGPIENNVYIVDDGAGCVIVDPTCEPERIAAAVGERAVDAVVITHGHWDHTGAAAALREKYGCPVIASAKDAESVMGGGNDPKHRMMCTPCEVDRTVSEGDVIDFGNTRWRVIETPGHTPGSVCFFIEPATGVEGAPVLISGDTLFAGTHGRTDFPGGDPAAMAHSLQRLAELPGETIVLPGHNSFTTIAREQRWLARGGIVR